MPYNPVIFDEAYCSSRYRGTIRFLEIVEPMQDRVLRQFGRQQSRPLDVIPPTTAIRPCSLQGTGVRYVLEFDDDWSQWNDREHHLCPYIMESPTAFPAWDVDEDYSDWFLQISHPYMHATHQIQPPIVPYLSAGLDEDRRMVLGLEHVDSVIQNANPTLANCIASDRFLLDATFQSHSRSIALHRDRRKAIVLSRLVRRRGDVRSLQYGSAMSLPGWQLSGQRLSKGHIRRIRMLSRVGTTLLLMMTLCAWMDSSRIVLTLHGL